MDYLERPKYHYKPHKGWINDPNGLVYFKGWYHVFYQYAPDFEVPRKQPFHWGHARTKDFLEWEELPVAVYPDQEYDAKGCWSGTALVKDDVLYMFYTSLYGEEAVQSVSIIYSTDGVHFEKYEGNPVIPHFPPEGGPDFRDPAVCAVDGKYYCVMAAGHPGTQEARLLLYQSDDLFHWEFGSILRQWEECKYAECPSMIWEGDRFLLTVSVCPLFKRPHYFSVMYGDIREGRFVPSFTGLVDKGPDQYAGQVFRDHLGRNLLLSWIPGWKYKKFAEKDIGCLSLPRELKLENGVLTGYPVEEVRHLLKDSDPALERTETGFIIQRQGRSPVVYEGEIHDLKVLRDGYILEVFVNGGRENFTAIL